MTQRTWHAWENAEQVDVTAGGPQALSVRDLLPHMQGMRKADIIRRLKMNWGKRQRNVSVIHSLAECQATAHQETAFSVLSPKVRCLLNPFRRPAHIPQAGSYFPRHFRALRLFDKTFCNRHAVCSAPADKKARLLPAVFSSVSDFLSSSSSEVR